MDGIEAAVRALRAAGDPTRLRILLALERRSLCVCELVALVDVGQPAVSRHLGILQEAGLVESVRDGRWVDYRLVDPPATAVGRRLLQGLRELVAADPAAAAFRARALSVDRRRLGAVAEVATNPCRSSRVRGARA